MTKQPRIRTAKPDKPLTREQARAERRLKARPGMTDVHLHVSDDGLRAAKYIQQSWDITTRSQAVNAALIHLARCTQDRLKTLDLTVNEGDFIWRPWVRTWPP